MVAQLGHASVAASSELASHAAAIGADAISVTPPTCLRPENIYEGTGRPGEIAAGAPSLQFSVNRIPATARVDVDVAQLLAEGANHNPALAGVKLRSAGVSNSASVDMDRFDVLFGVDEIRGFGLVAGACGAVGSTWNLIP